MYNVQLLYNFERFSNADEIATEAGLTAMNGKRAEFIAEIYCHKKMINEGCYPTSPEQGVGLCFDVVDPYS